ncbi:MAG: histidine ammonia-lyase, partial [Actinomycetota bacterium]
EILAATRAIDFRAPLAASPALMRVHAEIRRSVAAPGPDNVLADEMQMVDDIVKSDALRRAAEAVTGRLN